VAGTYSENWQDRSNFPTEVQVTYFDKEREYSRKSVIVRSDDTIVNHNTKDITLYACDDRDVALRHAEYILNMNLIKKGYAWTGDLDSMPLDMGDLVSIYGNLATITGVTFDEEMRRQFTAVNYSHERFGWKKWEFLFPVDGWYVHTLPFNIDGVTLLELYSEGDQKLFTSAFEVTKTGSTLVFTQANINVEWKKNVVYWMFFNPSVTQITNKVLYSKPESYSETMTLNQGNNWVSFSYDIYDYEASYAYINGINLANKVQITKYMSVVDGNIGYVDVLPDENGKINIYAKTPYLVIASENVDFPMFPPE
jgi:hypothetical protein